ncbi:MAG: response regulator [Candidatus Cloacimonetes bacterium]|nr:response regulator [Candidatus Cloacimonadota bacterium]
MDRKRILIVEDEKIVAEDIKRTLVNYHYEVCSMLSYGEEAVLKAKELLPDLILMDIMLEGEMDGIEAAEKIYKEFGIPVIFLTAYANEKILKKAAQSSPFGYLIKPLEDRELRASIEMALYKSKMENTLKASRSFLWTVIDTVPNFIFIKDKESKYVMVNKALADLYNTSPKEMIGKTNKDFAQKTKKGLKESEKFFTDDIKVIETKKPEFIPEEPFTMSDGTTRWFQTTKVPLDSPEKPDVLLGVAVDITELKNSYDKLQRLLEETVNGLVSAVEMRDPYTAGHQRRVSSLACAIAHEMDLTKDQINGIRIASNVHDIGKIYVPSEILSKPGRLTDVEFDLIKTHPKAGYDILCTIDFPWPVAGIVLQHHERMDGKGYPNRISGKDIIFEARILSVADVVEAISSHRPYRPALGIDYALNEIFTNKGILYDKKAVDVCLKIFKENKFKFDE